MCYNGDGKAGAFYETNFFVATFFALLTRRNDFCRCSGSAGGESAARGFENTRTVLLLPAVYTRGGGEAADYVNREMNQIFRYPYYRTLDTADYAGKVYAPSELSRLSDEAGADIVVMPVIQWRQWVYHRSFFMDADDIVETQATIDVYTYKKGEENTRDDRSRYWNREEEGMVRNRYILDDMMKQIFKTFPYKRVPTDIARNLSGETVVIIRLLRP